MGFAAQAFLLAVEHGVDGAWVELVLLGPFLYGNTFALKTFARGFASLLRV